MSDSPEQDRTASGRSGRVVMALFGLSLILVGGLFIFLMGRSYLRAKEMRDWPQVECVILESSLAQRQHDAYSPPEFSLKIAYGYEWKGKDYTGSNISLRGVKWSSKRQSVVNDLESYPVGSVQQCHLDPENPALAVLELDSLAPLYSIWFPALFVVGGFGMLLGSVKNGRKPAKQA